MKLSFRILLIVMTFCFAASVNAQPENRWFEVEGGSWIPDAKSISRIQQEIESFVGNEANSLGRELRPWRLYTFQYQGQEENGEKVIFVNAFCSRGGHKALNKEMVRVQDGGTCYFSLKYRPLNNQFFGLLINGEA